MVGLVVFLVFYVWIGLIPCSHIQVWIHGLVDSCSLNQMLVPHFFFRSNPRWFRNFLLELSRGGRHFLFQHTWRQNCWPLVWNLLGSIHAYKNRVLPCFVYTRVFAIFVLTIPVLKIRLMGVRTFLCIFRHTQNCCLSPCLVAHIVRWHPQVSL